MSVVTNGPGQSHSVPLRGNRGLARRMEARLRVLYREFSSELGTSQLPGELGGRGGSGRGRAGVKVRGADPGPQPHTLGAVFEGSRSSCCACEV